jgi:hypothetical protein
MVSLIAIVPDSECKMPILMVSSSARAVEPNATSSGNAQIRRYRAKLMDQSPVQRGASIPASCRMQPPVDHLMQGSHVAHPNSESRALKMRWLHFAGRTDRAIEQNLDKESRNGRFRGSVLRLQTAGLPLLRGMRIERSPVFRAAKGPASMRPVSTGHGRAGIEP